MNSTFILLQDGIFSRIAVVISIQIIIIKYLLSNYVNEDDIELIELIYILIRDNLEIASHNYLI